MLVKSKAKYIQSLSHKKQRDADGVFVAEGPKIINELLAAGSLELVELYALPGTMPSLAEADLSKLVSVDERDLEKISFLATPNQALGIFKKPDRRPFLPGGISLMLDTIQDPGNVGTIIRCADWFGVRQVICSVSCADVFGPKTVQSTMGSIARVNVLYEDLIAFIESHKGLGIYAATLDGKDIYRTEIREPATLVIGNESRGISSEVLSLIKDRVTIPRRGHAESLNAAVAAGIILSHIVK